MPPSSAWRLDPFSQGTFYTCAACGGIAENDPTWLGANAQALAKFDGSVAGSGVGQAWLALARGAPPVAAYTVEVYGYGSTEVSLGASDMWAGHWLGTLQMAAVTTYGEIAYFDATAFVRDTAAPYLAFNLRSNGVGAGEALSFQLVIAQVPEPGEGALMLAGLLGLAAWLRRRTGQPVSARAAPPPCPTA